jgi:activating signal cointegrator complex subunit 1
VPVYEDLAARAKVPLLQSIVSRLLVELVFEPYFVGLPPEQAKQLKDTEALLETFGKTSCPDFLTTWIPDSHRVALQPSLPR